MSAYVKQIGFFANSLTGFSLEEYAAPEIWLSLAMMQGLISVYLMDRGYSAAL